MRFCLRWTPPPPTHTHQPTPGATNPQEGNGALNRFNDGIMDEDGSVILGGVTEGNWADTNPDFDSSGDDFAAIKLDADGAVIWRWQVRVA